MPSWVVVVVLLVLVLAAGFAREHWRMTHIRRWCKERGFSHVTPVTPADIATLNSCAGRFRPRRISQWGVVLRGQLGDTDCTIAEHAEKPTNGPVRWHTLVITRRPGVCLHTIRIYEAPSEAALAVTGAVTAATRGVRTGLGIEVAESPPIHRIGSGRWALDTEDEAIRAFWTEPAQVAAIEAWTHGGTLAAGDEVAMWRVGGMVSATGLNDLLQRGSEVRSLFERAAGDQS